MIDYKRTTVTSSQRILINSIVTHQCDRKIIGLLRFDSKLLKY